MTLKEFALNFRESAIRAAEDSGNSLETELTQGILEYMIDCGEVIAPEICNYKKDKARLTAFDFNDEAESLDLFYFESADTVAGKINNNKVEQGFNYLMRFFKESSRSILLRNANGNVVNCDIPYVLELVRSIKGNISQLRIYYLTDGVTDPSVVPNPVESEDGDYIIEYIVWDIQRIYQQHNIRAGREKVEIDFLSDYNMKLQCLKVNDTNPFVDAYLAVIPGLVLAKIYKQYQQVLLEKNVRTFLQFKGKVNKQIRKTLRERPNMFFSYNNGISTTAREIELKSEGSTLYITRINDWQIVNGGQTTASISAVLNDRSVDLSQVSVSMKISVIRDKDHLDQIVTAISNSANSQTAIKNSDFSANDPYLIDIERQSRTIWVPNGLNKPFCKWYFERTRGQYLDQLAQLSGMEERNFKKEYPKNQKITKTDIAKYEASWIQKPFDVCRGAEKNYANFVNDIKRRKPEVTAIYFKKLVAQGILFKTIDNIVKSKDLGGYKSNVDAYIMASLSYLSNSNLNLLYIWEHQTVQKGVIDEIHKLIPLIWEHLVDGAVKSRSSDPNEWSKKPECWNELKVILSERDKIHVDLLQKEEDSSMLDSSQEEIIKNAESYSPRFWFSLADWANSNNQLSPTDRKAAFNFGSIRSKKKSFTSVKQASKALIIAKTAKELGFKEE